MNNKKRLMYGVNATFLVLLVIGIFIFGNIVVRLLFNKTNVGSIDITKDKIYSISQQTKSVLKFLNKDVTIYAFYPVGEENSAIKELLSKYQKGSKYVKVQFVDPDKNPQLAKELGITSSDMKSLLFKSGIKTKKINEQEFSFYDEYTREETFSAEPKITGAIMAVTSNKLPSVYFTQGHGEEGIDTNLSALKNNLQNEAYNVNSINLVTEKKVPDYVDILVIADPKSDFVPDEITKIRDYLNNGGKAAFLYDFESAEKDLSNLDKLVAEFGITVKKDIVVEGDTGRVYASNLSYLLPILQSNPITDKLIEKNFLVLSPVTRSLEIANEQALRSLNISAEPLLKTSKQAWSRTNFKETSIKKLPNEVAKEYVLAATASKTVGSKQVKVFVSGDSTFITNQALTFQGNNDFFLNVMGWMNDKKESISLRVDPKTIVYSSLDLSAKQVINILIFIFVLPFVILITGIVVWIRRRKL